MVMTTTEVMNGDGSLTPDKEADWQKVRNYDNKGVESDNDRIILSSDNTEIVIWEVEEVESIMMRQQQYKTGENI